MKINGEMKLEEVTTKEPLKFISAKINESYFEVTESDKSDYFNSERDVFKAIENRNKLNDFIKTIAPYIIMACVAIVVLYSVDTIGIYTNQIGATVSELLKAIGESSTDIVAQGKEVSGELNIPGVWAMGFYDALAGDNFETVEKTSKRNMWAWEFNRYSRLLFDLDKIRFMVFSGNYQYLPEYYSMLSTLFMSLRSMISKTLKDELEAKFKEFDTNHALGVKVMNDIGNEHNIYFVKCKNIVREIDFKLEDARQACGMKLPVDNKLSANSKAHKALVGNIKTKSKISMEDALWMRNLLKLLVIL